MKILIVTEVDNGGGSYELYHALKNKGHQVSQVTLRKNKLNYPCHIFKPGPARLTKLCNAADVVNIHHGPFPDRTYVPESCLKGKPVIITYHGTSYRIHWRKLNARDKKKGWLSTVVCVDLLRYCPNWLGRVVPDLSGMYNPNPAHFKVIHAPANPFGRKGTDQIKSVMHHLPVVFELVTGMSNARCLKRKAKGDLLINNLGVKKLGFATNALEAWSMGMPVIADAGAPGLYEEIRALSPGKQVPFIQAGTKIELSKRIMELYEDSHGNGELAKEWVDRGRKFIQAYHTPDAVVKTFMKYCKKAMR